MGASRIAALALAAACSVGIASVGSSAVGKATMQQARQPRGTSPGEWFGSGKSSPYNPRRRAAYGWTNRHAKRVAAKRRAVVRARKARRK